MAVCSSDFRSESLDHLGLVAAMCRRLGIARLVDQLLPPDPRCKATHGQRLVAMLLNGLGFASRTLYLTPEFLANKPVERLIGSGLHPELFNDDALGRTLDALHEHGLTQLYVQLAAHAVKILGLRPNHIHVDSTSFHLDGKYNSDDPPSDEEKVVHVTQGYSRDNHPNLNQVILHLIVDNSAGIPLLMKAVSGNQADQKAFRDILDNHISQLRQANPCEYVVADAALYTRENVLALHDQVKFITRMPQVYREASQAIAHARETKLTALDEKLSYLTLPCCYAGIDQRLVVVFSAEKYQRDERAVEKRAARQGGEENEAFQKLTRQRFSCYKDARKALETFRKKCKWLQLTDVRIVSTKQYAQPGRPSKSSKLKATISRIEGKTSLSERKKQEALKTAGYFVLVTNELDESKLSAPEVIREYGLQSKVERGFRFLKDPWFMAREFYVKKVERLMALTFVMTLCLLVYAACEYELRSALAKQDMTVPDQKKKQTGRPTLRWIFQCFIGIHLLEKPDGQKQTLNLKPHHLLVLKALGPPFEKMYA